MLEEIKKLLHEDLSELSPEAISIIEKVYHDEPVSEHEMDMYLSASETAAVLSVKYRKPVSRKYVKELARDFTDKESGHVTPARIKSVRKVGTSHLYKTRDVLAVRMIKTRQASETK